MTDYSGFGLAQIKREGVCFDFETGEEVDRKDYKPSPTRWIEMCYDPREDVSHMNDLITTISQLIDTKLLASEPNHLTEDDVYLLIKHIANKFVSGGY